MRLGTARRFGRYCSFANQNIATIGNASDKTLVRGAAGASLKSMGEDDAETGEYREQDEAKRDVCLRWEPLSEVGHLMWEPVLSSMCMAPGSDRRQALSDHKWGKAQLN